MSDIVIRNMEMPVNCFVCGLRKGTKCFVGKRVLQVDFDSLGDAIRHWDCPLAGLPPHGRLIDADALQGRIVELVKNGYVFDEVGCSGLIESAPTVLEASKV